MCAITGSFSQNKLTDLYRLNAYRGELSYSLSAFSFDEHRVRLDILMQDRDKSIFFIMTKPVIFVNIRK